MSNLSDKNFEKFIIDSLKAKSSRIGIVGLGYVGLPLALTFVDHGHKVLGFDIDKNKVKFINSGKSYFQHISNKRISNGINNKLLNSTSDFKRISEVEVIVLCLPTPLNKFREPDLSYILDTVNLIKQYLKKGQILSLESTTYPGTTEEKIMPLLEEKGFKIGSDFFLVYSPEREDPGNPNFNTSNIPKVVGGITKSCLNVGICLYQTIVKQVVPVSSTKTAEMTKLLENIHRAVNIGLINELKILSEKMSIDLYEVIRAASTKPFGFVPYYPGPGLGGHCIPIDPFYLTWKAKEYGMNTRFIELAGEINSSMPNYVCEKIALALNNSYKSVKGSKILVLGLAYKKNIDDLRESPSLEVINTLLNKGAKVDYSDPFFKEFPKTRKYNFKHESIQINKKNLNSYDLVLIATDHDDFDYELIKKFSKLIIDTRGRYEPCDFILRA